MTKSILYRLFGLGAIPKKLLPTLQAEGIVASDEGIAGRFVTRKVKGPGTHYTHRSERFFGCLVITKKRVICYTYRKRQINIAIDDPRISELYFDTVGDRTLIVCFESSVFREGWQGTVEFQFRTEKASRFGKLLKSISAQQGAPPGAENRAAGL